MTENTDSDSDSKENESNGDDEFDASEVDIDVTSRSEATAEVEAAEDPELAAATDEDAVDELDGPNPLHKPRKRGGYSVERIDPLADEFMIGDPAIDLATGRVVVIADRVAERTDRHSERENYEFTENYGNQRLRAKDSDPVYEAVYVNSLQSQPSKSYDFPSSRLGRPEYENVDGVRRVYDMVARDVLKRLFSAGGSFFNTDDVLHNVADKAGLDPSTVEEARELADVEERIGGSD